MPLILLKSDDSKVEINLAELNDRVPNRYYISGSVNFGGNTGINMSLDDKIRYRDNWITWVNTMLNKTSQEIRGQIHTVEEITIFEYAGWLDMNKDEGCKGFIW